MIINSGTGQVIERIDYDEFGNTILDTSPGQQIFGFAGGRSLLGTLLVGFHNRAYNPVIGRWEVPDPIGFAGGDTNLYGYTMNDPVNFIDPEGLYRFAPGAKGPLSANMDTAMKCFDSCTVRDTLITGGREKHASTDPHTSGNACDVGRNGNPDLSRDDAKRCFEKCFDPNSYGQEEENDPKYGGTHFHLQFPPGLNNSIGFNPNVRPYGH